MNLGKRLCLARTAGSVSAGLFAGGLVGLTEVLLLSALGGPPPDASAVLWAVMAYGLLGAIAGLLLGVAVGAIKPGSDRALACALSFALIFSGFGIFVTRYRLYRDLFHEGIRTLSLQGLLFHGGLLLAFAGFFLALLWLLRRPWLGRLAGTVTCFLAYGVLLFAAFAVASLFRPDGTLATAPAGIPPGLEDAPNILLIGADTLRADRLSCYGYLDSDTSRLDELAAAGVRYAEMTAQASWTKPSFASIFTSLYPSSHTATGKPHRLPQAVTTLAEVLAAGGYHTGGFADNPSITADFGFDQGFADYVYLEPDYLLGGNETASQLALYQVLRRVWAMANRGRVEPQRFYQEAAVVNAHATAWLEANKDTRFFLFLHYMDPHDPYFEHPYTGAGYARASDQNPPPELAPAFSRLYDGEVRYLDEQLGQLFDWLKDEGLYEDMLIVLTGDHGEEFQEHGGWWHGQTLYQEQVAVPLIIRYPTNSTAGLLNGSVDYDLVRSLDIAPTILDVAGLPIPDAMMGRSLSSSSNPAPKYAFSEEDHEGNVLQAVRSSSHKLILANGDNPRGLPTESLFDLRADPGEQSNLAGSQPAIVQELMEPLRRMLVLALEAAVVSEEGELGAAIEDRLRDLGY